MGTLPSNQDTLSGGQINIGSASVFAVLTSSSDWIRGGSVVKGDIGIDQGKFTLSGGSDVFGDLIYHKGVAFNTSGGSIHGRAYSDDPLIDSALMDAQMLSDAAFAEPVTPRYATLTSVNLNHSSLSITGGANEKVVLRLTDFVLTDNSTFTLSGTATTSFIINVTQNFSLTSHSHISLVNVPASNVLFNLRGTRSTFALKGGSTMSGTLLALNRKVKIKHSKVFGRVIANQLKITKHSVLTPTTNQ
jgi:choice-of-anchor A domain-containing protein